MYINLVGNLKGRDQSEDLERRWDDNIRMDLKDVGCEDVDWIHQIRDRNQWRVFVNTVMNLRVP
jgi:hypothetical protein